MKYPKTNEWCQVLFRTLDNPNKWRKGMFYWNGTHPTFASYGSEIQNVIEWKVINHDKA